MALTFREYMIDLNCPEDYIVGQLPPERIELAAPQLPVAISSRRAFQVIDPEITHQTTYKGIPLSFVCNKYPLPEYWLLRNPEGDPYAYTVFSYIAQPCPEIDATAVNFTSRHAALSFLR